MNAPVQQNNIVLTQIHKVASAFNMNDVDPQQLKQTLIDTVFKGANDVQLVSLLIVANQYKLNPFTKEIHAFPAKGGGITPVVGIDGWARIINDNPLTDGIEFEQDNESCTCKIYRKDRSHPTVVTEYLSECQGASEPWKRFPKRMLRHKALIQCARVAFGFSGIYDEDEAHRINDCQASELKTVVSDIPDGYHEFEQENLQKFRNSASNGTQTLLDMHATLPKGDALAKHFWRTHSEDFKAIAELADQNIAENVDDHFTAQ